MWDGCYFPKVPQSLGNLAVLYVYLVRGGTGTSAQTLQDSNEGPVRRTGGRRRRGNRGRGKVGQVRKRGSHAGRAGDGGEEGTRSATRVRGGRLAVKVRSRHYLRMVTS
jgi:hypothetical protein